MTGRVVSAASVASADDPWTPTINFLAALSEYDCPRPDPVSYCKTCLGKHDLKPLPGQETISPGRVVHYGQTDGRTLCGKDATGDRWWWPL